MIFANCEIICANCEYWVLTASRVRNKYFIGGHHISYPQYAPHQLLLCYDLLLVLWAALYLLRYVVRGYNVYACCLLCVDCTCLVILLFPLCSVLYYSCAVFYIDYVCAIFFLMFVCFVLLSVGVWIFIKST